MPGASSRCSPVSSVVRLHAVQPPRARNTLKSSSSTTAGWIARASIQSLLTGNVPSFGNPAALHFINHQQLNLARSFGKGPPDLFMVNHDGPHHHATQQSCVEIRLLKSSRVTLTKCRRSTRQQLRGMLEHLRVLCISREKCVNVAGVEGIQLSLHNCCRIGR